MLCLNFRKYLFWCNSPENRQAFGDACRFYCHKLPTARHIAGWRRDATGESAFLRRLTCRIFRKGRPLQSFWRPGKEAGGSQAGAAGFFCIFPDEWIGAARYCFAALSRTLGRELLRTREKYSTTFSGSCPSLFVNSSISIPAIASV